MSLPASGHYLITSNKNHHLIGRHLAEDLSLLPKSVYQLPTNSSNDFKVNGWIVEELEGRKYILRAKGAPTGVFRDNRVSAILLSQPAPEHWVLETTDQANVYVIKTSDGKLGWTIEDPSAEDSPVSTPSYIQGSTLFSASKAQGRRFENTLLIKVTDHPDKFDFTPVKSD
ncbi:hypothetical protein K474DRAFT_1705555 [Panus rudis PR-1116 ss-1]|nr:hypothetical protein K474DRAFT_1705555 [Panus rudis PR-1116 ss-1]